MEHGEEDDTAYAGCTGKTGEHPHDGGIVGGGSECFGESGAERVREEVHGLHEGLHAGRCFGVCVLETGDRGENLRQTDEDVGRGLDGDVNSVALGFSVDLGGRAQRFAVAWTGVVDQVLHDSGVHHSKRGDDEAKGDTGDRAEGDLQTAHQGVDAGFENGNENDDGDGVEVLHQIVGNAVAIHLTGLGDEVAGELSVDDPVDRVEGEHAAGDQGALQLVDEVVVPVDRGRTIVFGLPGGLGGIHVAVLHHHPDGTESIRDDGALGWANDVELAAENDHQGTDHEHTETEKIGWPEVDVQLHVGSSEQGQRTEVDASVEDHVDTLNCQGGVNDDALALLGGGDGHLLALVLIRNQRSHITLDATGTQTNDQDGDNETADA